jgi:hypothetical protein
MKTGAIAKVGLQIRERAGAAQQDRGHGDPYEKRQIVAWRFHGSSATLPPWGRTVERKNASALLHELPRRPSAPKRQRQRSGAEISGGEVSLASSSLIALHALNGTRARDTSVMTAQMPV